MITRPAPSYHLRRYTPGFLRPAGARSREQAFEVPAAPRDDRRFSLRLHLIAVVLAAILPAVAIVITVGINATRIAERATRERIEETTLALAGSVNQEMETLFAAICALAADAPDDDRGDDRGDGAELARSIRLIEVFSGLQIVVRPYDPLARDAGTGVSALDPAARARADAIAHGRLAISDVFPAQPTRLPVALVVVPMLRHGTVVRTLETTIEPDRLTAVLRRQSRTSGGLAAVLDAAGRVAASTRDAATLTGRPWQEVPGTRRADLPRAAGWQVVYREDETAIAGAHRRALRDIVVASTLAAAVGLSLAALLAGRLTRPLAALTEQARNVAIGDEQTGAVMQSNGVAEFEALRRAMMRADAVLRRRGAAERMALREARTGHELLVSVVNGTAESIYVKDLDLRYVLVNRAALQSGPVLRAEWQVLGRGTSDLFPPVVAARIEAADRAVLATGRMMTFEQEYTLPARAEDGETDPPVGNTRWLSMTIAPWLDAEGQIVGVVSVSRDITQQRAADTRMRAIQADLLRATRLSAMGAMASGLAHELNQPLAAATNYLNAGGRLLDRGAQGDVDCLHAARGAVTDAAQQMLRAGAIVRRLRDFVERGEAELQPEDVGDVLRQACDLARNDGVTTGIALRLDVRPGTGMALVDRTQIQQVLLNLIRNAAEAIGDHLCPGAQGGFDRPGMIVVSAARSEEGRMQIDVTDNGPGLAPDIAERLFEPFVSTKPTGMGIGLAICRTIIEGHGGQMTGTRNPAGGMVFRITLPALLPVGEGL